MGKYVFLALPLWLESNKTDDCEKQVIIHTMARNAEEIFHVQTQDHYRGYGFVWARAALSVPCVRGSHQNSLVVPGDCVLREPSGR